MVYCSCVSDDIIVFSRDFETHLKDIKSIFIALRRAGIKLKPAKCELSKDKLLKLKLTFN